MVVKASEGTNLPDFIIIGAAKSGTTSLYHYLSQHPEIFMSVEKELHYFISESEFKLQGGNWHRGLDWYKDQFKNATESQLCGEASVTYTYSDWAEMSASRMHHLLPHVKLIYIMRDPMKRVYSDYLYQLYRQKIPPSLSLNSILDQGFVNDSKPVSKYFKWMVQSSLYSEQLTSFVKRFGIENIYLMTFESLIADTKGSVKKLFSFLGVDDNFAPPNIEQVYNATDSMKFQRKSPISYLKQIPFVLEILSKIPSQHKEWYRKLIHYRLNDRRLSEISSTNQKRLLELFQMDIEKLTTLSGVKFLNWNLKR